MKEMSQILVKIPYKFIKLHFAFSKMERTTITRSQLPRLFFGIWSLD